MKKVLDYIAIIVVFITSAIVAGFLVVCIKAILKYLIFTNYFLGIVILIIIIVIWAFYRLSHD